MTKNKIFDIIIIENESEGNKMIECVIFLISLIVLGIGGMAVTFVDYIDRIHYKRTESKRKFLRTHKGYGLDSKGKIVKL